MSAELIILISDNPKDSWIFLHDGVEGIATSQPEKAALAELSNGQARVIINGQNARIFIRDLPNLRGKDRLAAAGFAVEDGIATSLTDHHIAMSVIGNDTHIAVVSHDYMTRLQDSLRAAGLRSDAIFIDHDSRAVDAAPVVLDGRIIVAKQSAKDERNDAHSFTIDKDWDDGEFKDAPIITAANFMATARFDGAVNLAQGRYALRRSTVSFSAWGRVAALLAATCAAGLLWQASTTRALNLQTAALRVDTAAIFSQATGQAAPANPALAATRLVQSSGGSKVDFLTLSTALFDTIGRIDGVMIDGVQYVAGGNQLTLQILYPNFDTASQIETLAREAGFAFQAGGVREQGSGLRGDAVLTRLGDAP
ncbi:type II secretion system protein GspL [Fretibacter rubidus]|uniref:type II secretion system protein GspL n=1 Tax=Fretibacter rubidus TaxID=570162 RepID=UPI00352AC7B6